MHQPTRITDLEVSKPIPDFTELSQYEFLQLIVRWRGQPIDMIKLPVRGDRCLSADIATALVEQCATSLMHRLIHLALVNPNQETPWDIRNFTKLKSPPQPSHAPTISVAVCTRDRSDHLARCLKAINRLEHPPLEILVIDNAPKTQATRELIESSFPNVSYVLEPTPGLNWARNRAIASARGDVIAITDDDVVVDPLWTDAIARLFAEDEQVMAVTGLVVPYELETEAQILFEKYGGFGRGFSRKWYRASDSEHHHLAQEHAGTGKFGTGANMAFRRSVFQEIGPFDPALDVGTVTNGGGDLDMFFRVLKFGHTLVYEPAAMVRHRHRRDFAHLHTQIKNNGIGFYSYLVRNAIEYPEERCGLAKFAAWWLWHWNFRRWINSKFKPTKIPRELISSECLGTFVGLFRYPKAKQRALALSTQEHPTPREFPAKIQTHPCPTQREGIAIRTWEITSKPVTLDDVSEYDTTRLILTRHGSAIAKIQIRNLGCTITPERIADEIIQSLGTNVLDSFSTQSSPITWAQSITDLKQYAITCEASPAQHQPKKLKASVVIATYDRTDSLRTALHSLAGQQTSHSFQIIVVDNHPESGLTSPVVAEFPSVIKIDEPRGGLSYARNAGFCAAEGEILVCTDDDVTFPTDWLENLLEPFERNDVMLVTGNVLPVELETQSQVEFENYGGLGRGFKKREFNRDWFNSFRRKAVPTWIIGATANAAIRSSLLHDPAVGLLDDALGTGTPTGCSEDTYFFYKTLKAGHTIIYTPKAFVWHKHRISPDGLHRQILNYSKGHIAYHLTTFFRDRDCRGLVRIFGEIPMHHMRQLMYVLRGQSQTSLRTIFLEIKGNVLGPLALWKSRRRVRALGCSPPFLGANPRATFNAHEHQRQQAEHCTNTELETQS